ncbi:MAG: cupin domain-containing protein [Haloarculaceae archaeon]
MGAGGGVGDHVVSAGALDWDEYDPPREGHRFRRKQLGAAAGGAELGASLYEVPPGKRTWLPHYHTGNEEAVYVLAGEGTVTLGVDRAEFALCPGDYVALPTGEAGYHDVVAGEDPLRYLMFSTMRDPDVTVYPDDDKVGLYAGSAPGGDADARTLSTYLDRDADVDYWSD